MDFFLLKSYSYRVYEFKSGIIALKLIYVPTFWKIGQKIKKLEFGPRPIPKTVWRQNIHVKVTTSSNFLMVLRDFVTEYHYAKSDGKWTKIEGEKSVCVCGGGGGGGGTLLWKYHSLNRESMI